MEESINKQLKLTSTLMKNTLIIYAVSFIVMMILIVLFSYINEDVIFENLMLNYRSYLLGSLNESEDIFSARFDTINIFIVFFTVFFALFFLYIFIELEEKAKLDSEKNKKIVLVNLAVAVLCIISILTFIFMGNNFLFALPEAVAVASLIYFIRKIFMNKLLVDDKIIIWGLNIFLIIISLTGIIRYVMMMTMW